MSDRLETIAKEKFGVDSETLLDILESSHGADGYILGALGETKFKEYAEKKGFEVLRIKEKPEGAFDSKSDDAKGDFYIRKKGSKKDEWYVVECKSVKSNAEARTSFGDKRSCVGALKKHSVTRKAHIEGLYLKGKAKYEKTKEGWPTPIGDVTLFADLNSMLEKMRENGIDVSSVKNYRNAYNLAQKSNLNFGIKFPDFRWSAANPGPCVPDLSGVFKTEQEINEWVSRFSEDDFSKEAFWNLKAPLRLIQTHMPSSRVDVLGIESTGPLVTEFNILCLDLFIRTGKHELVFVNSQDLNPQASAPNHLQQNYTVDILVEKDGFKRHELLKPWYNDLDECIASSKPTPRKIDMTQVDNRK